MYNSLIIPAGGTGERFGSELPKQFHILKNKPIIIRTIEAFSEITSIENIVIPTPKEHITTLNSIIKEYNITKKIKIIEGGKERQDSVLNALGTEEVAGSDLVLIHDAVRPLISKTLIEKLIKIAEVSGGAVPALIPCETIRKINSDGSYNTLQRNTLRSIQTPQVFKTKLITDAYAKAINAGFVSTDDAAVFEFANYEYLIINGEEENIKITTPKDLLTAEFFLK